MYDCNTMLFHVPPKIHLAACDPCGIEHQHVQFFLAQSWDTFLRFVGASFDSAGLFCGSVIVSYKCNNWVTYKVQAE